MRAILVISSEEFSLNMRALRKHLGWTPEYFCRHYRIEPWMLERIEQGDYEHGLHIYLDSMLDILKQFHLDLEELCTRILSFE